MESTARRSLPPVERILPGLWTIPVPLPPPWQAYVLVYVFETKDGPYLIDVGWNDDDGWDALSAGFQQIGARVEDVQGIVVTHVHSDHIGLANRVRERSGAWVALHPLDAKTARERLRDSSRVQDRVVALLERAGMPDDEINLQAQAMFLRDPKDWLVDPDVLLEDQDHPDIPGWRLTALWTPGHTAGHLCVYDEVNRLMFTGDHVLPRITPNISVMSVMGENPLGSYLQSLSRLEQFDEKFDVVEVLPAHEYRFRGLGERAQYLKAHHEERLSELFGLLALGPASGWALSERLTWSRPWDQITGTSRRSALGETLSHLEELEARGLVREQKGRPSSWRAVMQ